jgi:hypothetical protein
MDVKFGFLNERRAFFKREANAVENQLYKWMRYPS